MTYTELCKDLFNRCIEIGELLGFDTSVLIVSIDSQGIMLTQDELYNFKHVSLDFENLNKTNEFIIEHYKDKIST